MCIRDSPDSASLAAADRADLETMIQSTGFFRAKSQALLALSADLVQRYDGEVPGRLKDLVTLRGVGRKTANVVLGNAFGVPGITVDTHFGRLARRFGWTTSEDPVSYTHLDVYERQPCDPGSPASGPMRPRPSSCRCRLCR